MPQSQGALALDQSPSVFNFGDHAVRIVIIDGEPWFIASDVARALEYRDAEVAARHLKPHQKGVHQFGVPPQKHTIINESGLYRLVLRSRKPEAEAFSDWVTGEVLPSIRKTGGYGTANPARSIQAQSLAAEVAAVASRTVYEAVMAGQDLEYMRWMFSLRHITLSGDKLVPWCGAIDRDAHIASMTRLAEMILMPNGMCPTDAELAGLASACIQRLNRQITYRASR